MPVGTGPLLIAVLAGAFLHEGFPRRLFAGLAVALAGTSIIGFAGSRAGSRAAFGVVLCVVAVVAYASAAVVQKSALARASAFQVTWLGSVAATIACLPFAASLARDVGMGGATSVGWIVYLGRGSDDDRLRHVVVRARSDERRPHGRRHLSDPPDRGRAGLGTAR